VSDRIELRGVEVYARHGVLAEEQERAQVFRVDLTVFADLSPAGRSDELDDTIDYRRLAEQVRETVGGESHNLIERVAHRVAETVLTDPKAVRVVITIHKPEAELGAVLEDVSVTIDRTN
jgi:dihydroneopterin aldolase